MCNLHLTPFYMETLIKLGAAGATPFVVQWLLDLWPAYTSKLPAGLVRLLAVVVGAALGVVIFAHEGGILELGNELYLAAFNGGVDGAIATAAVSLVGTIATKAKK